MKLSSQEEYGLRCLLRLGAEGDGGTLTIPEISRAEGISPEYVAKLMRIMRRGELVKSARGAAGGYTLARPADQITVGDALNLLGGRLFESGFCERHSGVESLCTHSIDCSLRSLWRALQTAVDQVLTRTTLKDLLCSEPEMVSLVTDLVKVGNVQQKNPDDIAGFIQQV
ncbi:MAG TPA: Rrf2 family transcriptional regulator [Blastocatellia bacterium]|nr:Rrf2 family transcriptional regulator [Blastocatellia bacterium]